MKSSLRYAALAAVILSLATAAGQVQAQSGTNVAVIDVPYVFKNFHQFQENIEVIRKDIEEFKKWMGQQQQRLRLEAEKLEQFNQGTPEYKAQEESLARDNVNVKLEAAKRQKQFMEREAQEYYDAFQKIQEQVAKVAGANNISLVLRYSSDKIDPLKRESIMAGINTPVVYQAGLNITPFVLDAVNAAHPPKNPVKVANPTSSGIPPR